VPDAGSLTAAASVSPTKPPVVLHPSGRLNLVSAPQLRVNLRETVEAGDPFVVIDLAEITFIDSSGLAALVSGLKACRQAGGDLRIAAPTEQVQNVLQVTTLDQVLHPYASVEQALTDW